MSFESIRNRVIQGMAGGNSGIPMGFNRLNNYVSIRSGTYYLIGGYTGSGKTSLIDDAFVLNPLDYLAQNKDAENDLHILYNSMERPRDYKLAKWVSRKIFLDTGRSIPLPRLLGWVSKEKRLTNEEFELFDQYEDYVNYLLSKITFYPEGAKNPTGARKFVDAYAKENGKIEKIKDERGIERNIYTANNPKLITLNISDHVGLHAGETVTDAISKERTVIPKGKPAIDKCSEDKQRFRDLYNISSVDIQQFNRDISNPMRLKNGDVEPMLEDFKETGNIAENADVVLSLFDPWRYKVADPNSYNLDKLRDEEGAKLYRALKILKNTYGSEDIGIGLAFQPYIGMFKEMPKKKRSDPLPDSIYTSIIDHSYFLNGY